MSNLLTGIAPQASLIAQSSGSATAQSTRAVHGNVAQNQVVQTAVASGAASNSAVVVSLSGDSKSRAASYGEGRSVDATFEQHSRDEKKAAANDENSSGEKKQTAVSVTA